ncbi:MAG: hypothetical protein A6F70_02695 [Cycloclasticus sp. symbiont of Bathymodiolus heckerae]|nr:MAG: hypothetical protein A6F70_02695 [Cycloclasticus sp. symbiont of Bathymodiolus heckerae]
MNLRRFISVAKWLSDEKKLELFPPFWMMRLNVTTLTNNWREIRIKLPRTWVSRNHGGGIFGGFQASLADPIAAIACTKVFPGYAVWTRSLHLDFQHEANTDITLHFDLSDEMKTRIKKDLESKGRSTPTFTMYFKRTDGTVCTLIKNTVAIRPMNYKKPTKQSVTSQLNKN